MLLLLIARLLLLLHSEELVMKLKFYRCVVPALFVSLLAACSSVVPPSAISAAAKHHALAEQVLPGAKAANLAIGTPAQAWWQAFEDERLNSLVEQATERNHDLQATLATVREARVLEGLAEREYWPVGSAQVQAQRLQLANAIADPFQQSQSRPSARNSAALQQSVSWELDLFGRIGTSVAIAERQADMAAADAHAATALLQAEVVRRYVQLRRFQQELALVEDEHKQLVERSALMQARVTSGLEDPRAAQAALAAVHQATAEQAALLAAVAQEKSALAVLAGRSPTDSDAVWVALLAPADLPNVPAAANLLQPTDLLQRRPDVVRADAALRASLGDVVLAERAYLPHLSLNLVAGVTGSFGNLSSALAQHYAAGPVLQWDWLSSGRLQAQESATRARSERAWHLFEQTVLKALESSDNALQTWVAARNGLERANAAEAASQVATAYTQGRSKAGLEPITLALEAAVNHSKIRRQTLSRTSDALLSYSAVQLELAAWQP
jgi:NodT family efflux transporter outer membrane factor (OMF) lipoprotein